jgi:hypothetical protein
MFDGESLYQKDPKCSIWFLHRNGLLIKERIKFTSLQVALADERKV